MTSQPCPTHPTLHPTSSLGRSIPLPGLLPSPSACDPPYRIWLPLWASLVAQKVKNPSAMQETWVGKIPLEEDMATHSSIPAWGIPTDREAWQATVPWGGRESNGTERLSTAHVGCQTDVCFKHQLFFMTAHMTGGSKKPPNHICQLQSLKLSPTNKRYQTWVFP